MDIEQLKEKAGFILRNSNIDVLTGEKEILEKLDRISIGKEISEADEKDLAEIEVYLKNKTETEQKKADMEFLKNIAEALREQNVRITDNPNPPLFKIKNALNEDVFFLTRNALAEFKKCNMKENAQVIEISETNSYELAHLLEIIQRNF